MTETAHKPATCQSCHTELPFIEYATKTGKNGKPAKWPVYAKCTNPECKTGRKNLGVQEEPPIPPDTHDPRLAVPIEVKKSEPFKLYQLTNRKNPPLIFDEMLDALKEHGGTGRIQMQPDDIVLLFNTIQGTSTPILASSDGEGGIVLMRGSKGGEARSISVIPKDWKGTKGYGYFTVEETPKA